MARTDPEALLAGNHDLHLHSLFSDGWHEVVEVTGFVLRWLEADRWIGLSDHNPFLPDVVAAALPDASSAQRRELEERVRASSPREVSPVQQALDAATGRYFTAARAERPRVRQAHGAELLVGIEVDWYPGGMGVSREVLEEADYVLMGYHGRRLADAGQAEAFLRQMIRHPLTDVLVHPDQFLGPFDARACDWRGLFRDMARLGVLCEYNLATPLPDDLLALALAQPDLVFTIGSDTHDCRRAHRRVLDAWGESTAGGFDRARSFLDQFVTGPERELYATPELLAALDFRLWSRTRRVDPITEAATPGDAAVLAALDAAADTGHDRAFLAGRLARFAALPPERVASLLPREDFLALLRRNRRRRERGGD